MASTWDAVVVGAGPAGAMAAAALARAGARVLLCERRVLPQHRLCGEFVSGEAAADLNVLGLDLADTPAVPLSAARVHAGPRQAAVRLAPPGWAVSRHFLDAWIARRAAGCGAQLRERTGVAGLQGDPKHGFRIDFAGGGTARARVAIVATGRGGRIGTPEMASVERPAWVALKLHVRGGPAAPDRVELYAFPGGYVGTAPVGGGRTNVCLVARRSALAACGYTGGGAGALRALLASVPEVGRLMDECTPDPESLRAASGMRFGAGHAVSAGALLVGDAAAAPHPLVGDGMAMALRSGRMAARHALRFLEGRLDAAHMLSDYERAWRSEFGGRLRWARALHGLLERPVLAGKTLAVLGAWPHAFEYLVRQTRGTAAPVPVRPGQGEIEPTGPG